MKVNKPQKLWHVSDFDGSGQYILRVLTENIESTSYLSTVMYKVGYHHHPELFGANNSLSNGYCLVSMADGYTSFGYHDSTTSEEGYHEVGDFHPYLTKQNLADHLNDIGTYRKARHEEVIRVITQSDWRFK